MECIGPTDPCVDNPEELKRRLREGGFQLLHFTGHGQFNKRNPDNSALLLGRPGQQRASFTANEIAQVARASDLTFVFFNACELGAAGSPTSSWNVAGMIDALTRNGVPAALGMRWRVGNLNGRKLVERFYGELLAGTPSEVALLHARQSLNDQPDWANPVLTKRHGML